MAAMWPTRFCYFKSAARGGADAEAAAYVQDLLEVGF